MNRKSHLPKGICVDTGYEGTEMFLGSLEVRIMEILWDSYPNKRTCKSITRSMNYDRSLSTVTTTANKLVEKNMLTKVKGNKNGSHGNIPNEFAATCSREEFIEIAVRRVMDSLKEYFPDALEKII